jgi:hypothetical protein
MGEKRLPLPLRLPQNSHGLTCERTRLSALRPATNCLIHSKPMLTHAHTNTHTHTYTYMCVCVTSFPSNVKKEKF